MLTIYRTKKIDGIEYGPISFWEWLGCKLGFHLPYPGTPRCESCGKLRDPDQVARELYSIELRSKMCKGHRDETN